MRVTRFELYIKYSDETGVVQVILTDESGRTVDPISLLVGSEFVMSFSELFSQSQQQTITALTSDKATLLSERNSLQSQIQDLTASVDNLTAEVASLQPWNKRWISAKKFVSRFKAEQTREVYTSKDATLIESRQLLDEYIAENYHIDLDDLQVTSLTAYMVSVKILTEEDRVNILRDSNSSERYVPNE